MRITKKERNQNARRVYSSLQNHNKAIITTVRGSSTTNSHVNRVQIIGVSDLGEQVIIGETATEGRMYAFLEFLKAIKPVTISYTKINEILYDRAKLNNWLNKEYGFRITFDDQVSMMLETK